MIWSFVLVIFVGAMLLYWLHSFFILYHLIRFGIGTKPKKASLVVLTGTLLFFLCMITAFTMFMIDIPPVLSNLNVIPQY